MTSKEILKKGKKYIELNSTKDLTYLIDEINSIQDYNLSTPHLFKSLFLYTCSHGTREILIWFMELYYELGTVEQIALRQLFFYGKHLSKKNKLVPNDWFDINIIPLIKIY
tara:strand:+ start:20 stop:352 length:333 start_codon:yes stop_codon:yes gene_type:complete